MAAYAIGVPKSTSIDSFEKYWKRIIMPNSFVVTVPAKAMNTKATESMMCATAELPMVLIHK